MPNADNARVYSDGAIRRAPFGSPLPTDIEALPGGTYTDLGFVSEDGIAVNIPVAGDSEIIRAWQGRAQLRVIRTPTDDLPTWTFALAETSRDVLESVYGVTIGLDGSAVVDTSQERVPDVWVFDYIDGTQVRRDIAPRGVITEVAEHTISATGVTTYQITVSGEYSPAINGNFQFFVGDVSES